MLPLLAGRVNHDTVAATGEWVSYLDPRIKQGVVIGAPGRGGDTDAWQGAKDALTTGPDAVGAVEST